mmetsp:Transcript_39215/g.99344  ORF Transcript_39215/g.99344 Transcript_39215/m.99344 type:complete len:130 (-) Transcript_39215:311-700(-)
MWGLASLSQQAAPGEQGGGHGGLLLGAVNRPHWQRLRRPIVLRLPPSPPPPILEGGQNGDVRIFIIWDVFAEKRISSHICPTGGFMGLELASDQVGEQGGTPLPLTLLAAPGWSASRLPTLFITQMINE